MAISVDSAVNDETKLILQSSKEVLESDIKNTISNDYKDFTELGLFSSQLQNIIKAVDSLDDAHDKFIAVINENKNQWAAVEQEVKEEVDEYTNEVEDTGRKRRTTGTGDGGGRNYSYTGGDTEEINHGVSVSNADVKSIIGKLDVITSSVLLKKLYNLNNGSITELLYNQEKSGILLALIKKLLGDTTELDNARTAESDEIQKLLLEKLGLDKEDTTTEEGKAAVDKKVVEKINSAPTDDTEWDKLMYGENTREVHILDGDYIIAKTKTTVENYESYIRSHGVKQDANTAEWGDSCLAFAGAHAYDLYNGTTTNGASAANYAHGGAFEDFIDDDKSVVLAKVYDEIMNGRPLVLQVNGNKAGTSRHFVTVVGFKKGVTKSSITEEDLLIVDSWDGKIERMDTESSRFMTSGKDCHKDYSGYRLRVFKSA